VMCDDGIIQHVRNAVAGVELSGRGSRPKAKSDKDIQIRLYHEINTTPVT